MGFEMRGAGIVCEGLGLGRPGADVALDIATLYGSRNFTDNVSSPCLRFCQTG